MSLIKANSAQIGQSNTATQNFTLTTGLDGTAKLARGNAGATTQDILNVDANGNVLVDGNNLNLFSAKSLAASGYQKLPSGLIIQWFQQAISTNPNGDGASTATFPIAFPNALLQVAGACKNASVNGGVGINSITTSGCGVGVNKATPSTSVTASFIAIGY